MTRRRRALADLDQDIREHLERETQENIERGMSPADARAAALRKFGNVGLIEEQTRAVWRRPWIATSSGRTCSSHSASCGARRVSPPSPC